MSNPRIYCAQALTSHGWQANAVLSVGDCGRIDSIEAGEPSDCDIRLQGPVLPGMPNCHSHGFQRLMAGLTGPGDGLEDSFLTWRELMYRLADRITAGQIRDCLAWVFAEMLMAGYTSCAEFHYLHHGPGGKPCRRAAENSLGVLEAADSAGMAVTLLPVLYQVSGFGQNSAGPGQQRFSMDLEGYLDLLQDCEKAIRDNEMHYLGIAPHSLRAVPEATLQALFDSLNGCHLPVHIHIAEQTTEVAECLAHHGARPVEWLLGHCEVDANWCLVHATHMTGAELVNAAASGATAGLCPTTEADLGDGFFASSEWLKAGGRFAIGSDSNLIISVSEELRLLEFSERLRHGRRNLLRQDGKACGHTLYTHAASAGGRCIGQPAGSLAPGLRADLVELDPGHRLLEGRTGDDVLESLVFAGGRDMVRSVFVAGRQVVSQGHHVNEAELGARFAKTMKALLNP